MRLRWSEAGQVLGGFCRFVIGLVADGQKIIPRQILI